MVVWEHMAEHKIYKCKDTANGKECELIKTEPSKTDRVTFVDEE